MPIPKIYAKPGSSAIASYNYSDIDDGTGFIIFQGYTHKENTNLKYALAKNIMYSNNIYTTATTLHQNPTFDKIMDLDFDIKFNMPQRIRGKATCTFTCGSNSTTRQTSHYAVLRIRKWDGTTETELYSGQSETNTTIQSYLTRNFQVDITNICHFKKDETLRATLEIWGSYDTVGNTDIVLFHDPKNRIDATYVPGLTYGSGLPQTGILEIHIPFVVGV